MTLRVREAVLLIRNGAKSLLPLEEQVRDKYAALLEVSNDNQTVTLRSDSIVEYMGKKAEVVEDQASGVPSDRHKSEVAIVRRFLKSVCDDELLDKFGFEEFLQAKATEEGCPHPC